jgi:glycine/D-amino acid oxidase-like deaminating enzyme
MEYDVVVVGAGAAGLGAAHHLVKELGYPADKVVVLEAKNRIGGRVCNTFISPNLVQSAAAISTAAVSAASPATSTTAKTSAAEDFAQQRLAQTSTATAGAVASVASAVDALSSERKFDAYNVAIGNGAPPPARVTGCNVDIGANWIHNMVPTNPLCVAARELGVQLFPTSSDDEPSADDVRLYSKVSLWRYRLVGYRGGYNHKLSQIIT